MKNLNITRVITLLVPIIVSVVLSCLVLREDFSPARFSSIAGILVAAATIELALVALFQLSELQTQSLEAQRASIRPLLIPDGDLPTTMWTINTFQLQIRNLGPGVATNAQAVLLGQSAHQKYFPNQFHGYVHQPIAPLEKRPINFIVGGTLIGEEDHISGISFSTSEEPKSGPLRPLARITITCNDIQGLKHASAFDYRMNGTWIAVKNSSDVEFDIDEIDAKNQNRHPRP